MSSGAPPSQNRAERRVEERLTEIVETFDPIFLASLVLAPLWSFDALYRALYRHRRQPGLGDWLDRAAAMGLIESTSIPEFNTWRIRLGAAAGSEKSRTTANLRATFRQAADYGLVSRPETFDEVVKSLGSIFPETPLDFATTDVRLASIGLRFWSDRLIPLGAFCRARLFEKAGAGTPLGTFNGVVAECSGDDWAGYDIGVVFHQNEQAAANLLPRAMHAEFSLVRRWRERLLPRLSQFLSGPPEATCVSLATELLKEKTGPDIPEPLARWARAVMSLKPGRFEFNRWLERQFSRLLDGNQTGDAHALLNTVQFLSPLFDNAFATVIGVCERRLELGYRQAVDERHLRSFLERKEQVDAFKQLIASGNQQWALHYLGVGGVGKTMLLRYLTSRELPALRLPFSRVDFDFLSPDYPVRRPAQLLLELAEGLRAFAKSSVTDEAFQRFYLEACSLHERLDQSPPENDPLANLYLPEFEQVLGMFCEVVQSLSASQVVLILDTCEELARLQPDGVFQPAVEATFDILERIQTKLNYSVRVIFAGRRPLALAGYGWERPDYHDPERRRHYGSADKRKAGMETDPRRDFLRLHIIRGFTRKEAEQFFQKQADKSRGPIAGEVEKAILDNSLDLSLENGLKVSWTSTAAENAGDDLPNAPSTAEPPARNAAPTNEDLRRFNPFDLSLFADWYLEDPSFNADTIRSKNADRTDPYIELRIVHRLRCPDVLTALPYLVTLRRCEKELLRQALPIDQAAFPELYRELCQLEWLDYQPGANNRPAFLEVARNLLPRFESYFKTKTNSKKMQDAKAALAPLLKAHVRDTELKDLQYDYLAAAFRVLAAREMADVWMNLEMRICERGDWTWPRQVCERLRGDEVISPALKAHVMATHLSASAHLRPDFDSRAGWLEVMEAAHENPDPETRRWLETRARFCHAAVEARYTDNSPSWATVLRQGKAPPPESRSPEAQFRQKQNLGAVLNWAETILESVEASPQIYHTVGDAFLKNFDDFLKELLTIAEPREAQLKLWTLRCRHNALVTERNELPEGTAITKLVEQFNRPEFHGQSWLDWKRPQDWLSGGRLELLRFLPLDTQQELARPGYESWWYQHAWNQMETIDADRLLAAFWKIRLNHQRIPFAEVEEFRVLPQLLKPKQPVSRIHSQTPAFVTMVARACLAHGQASAALQLLNQASNQRGLDSATVNEIRRARIEIIRRMRLSQPIDDKLEEIDEKLRAWPARRLVSPANMALPDLHASNPLDVIGWWRIQEFITRSGKLMGGLLTNENFTSTGQALDLINPLRPLFERAQIECMLKSAALRGNVKSYFRRIEESISHTSPQANRRAWEDKIWLSAMTRTFLPFNKTDLTFQTGVREIANWALDEGEMLALRFPEEGSLMLRTARSLFDAAEDHVGAAISSICALIALIHAKKFKESKSYFHDELLEACRALKVEFPALPLEYGLDEGGSPANSVSDWVPWMTRLRACVKFLKQDLTKGSKGLPSDNPILPVELVLVPPSDTQAVPKWKGFVVIGMSLVIIAVCLYYMAGKVLNFICGKTGISNLTGVTRVFANLGVVVAGGTLCGVGGYGFRRLRRWLTSRTAAYLRIESADQSSETLETVHLQFNYSPPRWLPDLLGDLLFRPSLSAVEDWKVTNELPKYVQAHLALLGFPTPVGILYQPSFRDRPYERFLFEALNKQPGARKWQDFHFFRCLPATPKSAEAAGIVITNVYSFSSPRWHADWETSWKSGGATRFISEDVNKFLAAAGEVYPFGDGSTFHLVGYPVETNSGLRLQIESSEALSRRFTKGSERQAISEQLTGPEQWPIERAGLVIIQAEPAAFTTLTDSLQVQTKRLRLIAADFFEAGAPSVLMLPVLPPPLHVRIIELVAEGLRRRPPTFLRLLKLTATLRSEIASWRPRPPSPSTAPTEQTQKQAAANMDKIALEVTLFSRTNDTLPT